MMRTRQHSCWRRRLSGGGGGGGGGQPLGARERLPPLQTHGNAVKEKLFQCKCLCWKKLTST